VALAATTVGGALSSLAYFFFASATQAVKSVSLTTRTVIGMNEWSLPHSWEH